MVLREGAILKTLRSVYVRDRNARFQCIEKHGTKCCICTFSFKARYGKVADGFIHVHHVRQLSNIRKEHKVDPVKHLRPVCPNCHAVLHITNPGYSIEEVKSFLR
jgi:predicted HNH restriction endonuclease